MTGVYKPSSEEREYYDVKSLGEGVRETSHAIVEFDHAMAEGVLNLNVIDGDRALSQAHVDDLVKAMQRGTFRPELVNLAQCKVHEAMVNSNNETVGAGAWWRINGQHTAWARLEMPARFRCPVMLRKYTAKTEYDVRQLYTSYDRGRARGRGQQSMAIITGVDELKRFHKSYLRYLDAAFGFWQWEQRDERRTHDSNETIYVLVSDHLQCAVGSMDLIEEVSKSGKVHLALLRAPVLGAMLATFDAHPRVAREFWEVVHSGVGVTDKYDPRLRLRDRLMTYSLNASPLPGVRVTNSETMYRWCLIAWNLWRSNEPAKNIKTGKVRPKIK